MLHELGMLVGTSQDVSRYSVRKKLNWALHFNGVYTPISNVEGAERLGIWSKDEQLENGAIGDSQWSDMPAGSLFNFPESDTVLNDLLMAEPIIYDFQEK